jgi:hypothetical protein
MNTQQEEKRPFEEMATELLRFLGISEENDPAYAYKLGHIRTFLETKLGYVQALQKEVAMLRAWKEANQPIVSAQLERQDLVRRNHPFAHLSEEG